MSTAAVPVLLVSDDHSEQYGSSQAKSCCLVQTIDIVNSPGQNLLGSLALERPVDLLDLFWAELRRKDIFGAAGHVEWDLRSSGNLALC